MRYVIVGAGGVGGVIGGLLAAAGREVAFVARGEHGDAIARDGLLLRRPEEELRLHVPVAPTIERLGLTPDDAVVLAVKSQHTAAAVADLADHAPPTTPIVCLQNGVANETLVLRRFARVHAITVMLPATHLEPGVVVQGSRNKPGILDVGRFPTGTDAIDEATSADLRRAGFASVARPDIMAWKHRKLLMNLANGVDAAFVEGEDADELAARCTAEGEAVLAAASIGVIDAATDRERRGDLLQPRTDVTRGGGSTWQSISRGLATEVDHLSGEIVLLGRLHGVPTPANAAVQMAVHDLERRAAPARSMSAASVIAELAS